jgi:cellulose synthase/poly-beta-1,6-N-acetylglucosamine synthase-like glycosyltransferase
MLFLASVIPLWIKRRDFLFLRLFSLASLPILAGVVFTVHHLFVNYYFMGIKGVFSIRGFTLLLMVSYVVYVVYMTLSILIQRYRGDALDLSEKCLFKNNLRHEPFISIHIPARNENPTTLIDTIKAVLNSTYQNFEIIVVINNTHDMRLVSPVLEFVKKYPQIKCVYKQVLKGFKSGALNLALLETSMCADIVGVLDADYVIQKECLDMVVLEYNKGFEVVQFPQSYNVLGVNSICLSSTDEQDLFRESLHERALTSAIVMQGTMLFIKKDVLVEAGAWNEKSIVEDAILGLSLISMGKKISYISVVYGRGEAPDTFQALCAQRSRWVSGTVSMVARNAYMFLGMKVGQLYHFFMGWLPWFLHVLYIPFLCMIAYRSFKGESNPEYYFGYEFFLPIFLVITASFFSAGFLYMYKGKGLRACFRQMMIQIALIPTIGYSALTGLISRPVKFITTRSHITIREKILIDLTIFLYLHAQVIIVYVKYGISNLDQRVWVFFLGVIMTTPFVCRIYYRLRCDTQYKEHPSSQSLATPL